MASLAPYVSRATKATYKHSRPASFLFRSEQVTARSVADLSQTVFSTGLFVLSTIPIFDARFPVNTTTKFDPALAATLNVTSPLDPQQVPNGALYSWYGHIAHGLPYTPGSTAEYVYQTFEAAGQEPSNASLSAEVEAFLPSANCTVIDVKLDGPSSTQGFNNQTNTTNTFATDLSLLLPDGNICKHWSYVGVPVQNPLNYVTPSQQLTGTYQGVYCSLTDPGSQIDFSKGPDAYLYTITNVEYTQKLFANATQLSGGSFIISDANHTSRSLRNMANVLCLPHYTITKLNITNSTTAFLNGLPGQTRIENLPEAQNHTISGFSTRNLSSLFEATAQAAPNLFTDTDLGDYSSASQVPSVMFGLLAAVKGSTDYSVFLNAQVLKSAAEDLFNGLTLEIVRQNLMSSDQTTTDGMAVYPVGRLYIRPTSLWVMVSGFGLLIILSILVLFFAPGAVVSRDPSSIAAHAAILTRSIDLNRELRKNTTMSDRSLRSFLAPHFYRASVVASDHAGPAFKVQVQSGPGSPTRSLPVVEWWHPMTLSSLLILAMVMLPAGAIVALELLQRASDGNNGLLTLPPDHFSEAYIHYLPALVMLLIATLFTALDFNVAVFSPFSALRSEHATSRRTISSRLLGKTAPFALFEAVRSWQLGALLSLIGALVASVLTVVVSGLYSVQVISSNGPTRTLDRLNVFNVSWENSYSSDNGAAATLSLIEHQNLAYPDFVYGELTFPSLSLQEIEGDISTLSLISGPATATLPALRANLNCTILAESGYSVSTAQAGPYTKYGVDEAFVNAEFDLPPHCQLGGFEGNQSTLQYANNFELVRKDEFVYAGAQLDILFGNGTEGTNYGENLGASTSDNPPGCPSLAFTFGRFRLNSTDRTNVTTMVCYQELQEVSAQVTLLANSTTIDTTYPPVVDEGSVKALQNPLSDVGSTAFEYRIQNNLLNEVATFNGSGYVAASGDVYTIDIFFQAVINGTDGIREQDLVGPDHHANFYQAVNRLYRKYMALAINANMRKPCPASGCSSDLLSKRQVSSSTLQATVSISTPRLVQSATSKLILQILLGVMLFCGISAYLLTPMRNILPCNPCTIAGTMALLAGSKLCWSSDETVCECCGKPRTQDADSMIHAVGEVDHHEERAEYIPHGAEWMCDGDLRAVFSRMRYTLGWWQRGYGDGKHGEGKRYGIDIGRADGLDDQDWELGRRRTRRYTDKEPNAHQRERKSRMPNWLMGPLKEEEPPKAKPHIAEELSANNIRQSRMPEWMLGPLKPDRGPANEHELQERDLRQGGRGGDLGTDHKSRIPAWLMGPLKADAQMEDVRGPNAGHGEAFASGALRGPDALKLGTQGA